MSPTENLSTPYAIRRRSHLPNRRIPIGETATFRIFVTKKQKVQSHFSELQSPPNFALLFTFFCLPSTTTMFYTKSQVRRFFPGRPVSTAGCVRRTGVVLRSRSIVTLALVVLYVVAFSMLFLRARGESVEELKQRKELEDEEWRDTLLRTSWLPGGGRFALAKMDGCGHIDCEAAIKGSSHSLVLECHDAHAIRGVNDHASFTVVEPSAGSKARQFVLVTTDMTYSGFSLLSRCLAAEFAPEDDDRKAPSSKDNHEDDEEGPDLLDYLEALDLGLPDYEQDWTMDE